jgi:tetratricopeptide (TPR) repeat protein
MAMAAKPKKSPGPPDPVGDLNALLEKARKAETSGDAAKALSIIEGAPEALRGMGTLHFARGSLLFRKGDVAAATAAFREACRLEPELPEFKANLGAALVETARRSKDGALLDEAIRCLESACAGGPRTALPHNNLGMALQTAGRLDEALEAFDRALEKDPKDLSALYNRAATLHMLGREEECLDALDATLEVDPKFEPALKSRESTLKRLGR